MKARYIAFMACAVAATLVFSGCPGGGTTTRDGDTLIIGTIGNPVSLDPVMVNDSASAQVFQQIFNTLFDLDFDTLAPQPALAERWQFENDGMALRVFLRSNVKFHNGDTMKASDVKFSLDRAMTSPQVDFIFSMIDSTQVVNDNEVLIRFSAPWAPALSHLAHVSASIVSERAVREMGADAFAQNPVGTGAMKFVNWVVGDRLELTRFDDFWGQTPQIKNITIRSINDEATRTMELETGGIHIMYSPGVHDIPRLGANPELTVLRRAAMNINYVGFNTQSPPLNDVRVRQAIVHALDLPAIWQNAFQGVGALARAPISSTVWASAAEYLEPFAFDQNRARQLLAEAGYPNGGITLTILTNEGNATRMDIAQMMQAMLAEVGITLIVSPIEWASYLDMTARGEHQMFILGWVSVTGDPDYGLDIFHSRSLGAAGNRFFFVDPEVDRLLDLARGESDMAARYQLYIQAQRRIHAGVPLIPIQEGETVVVVRRNVRGLVINPAGEENFWAVRLED